MHRGDILDTAKGLTCGDRNQQYGEPGPQMGFSEIQYQMWLDGGGHRHTPATRAAIHQVYTKLSRMAHGKLDHMDNFFDAAAYIAIAGENVDTEGSDEAHLSEEATQHFIDSYDLLKEKFDAPSDRSVALGVLPEGVNRDHPRVQEIMRKCRIGHGIR